MSSVHLTYKLFRSKGRKAEEGAFKRFQALLDQRFKTLTAPMLNLQTSGTLTLHAVLKTAIQITSKP